MVFTKKHHREPERAAEGVFEAEGPCDRLLHRAQRGHAAPGTSGKAGGNFSRAAEKFYLSQPTISTHIRQLEEELHTCLIVRTKRSVEVTSQGRELYECACSILNLRDNLLRRWTEESGRAIQPEASTIPSSYLLPELLSEYGRLHPVVYFIIHQSDSQGVAERILDGSFDLGMVGWLAVSLIGMAEEVPADPDSYQVVVTSYLEHSQIDMAYHYAFLLVQQAPGEETCGWTC